MYLEELFGMKGKTAAVTGGNKGIGRVLAVGMAKAGADLVILSRSGAEDVIREIEAEGRQAYHVEMDVTSDEDVENAIGEIDKRSGRIDVLVNNAGVTAHRDVFETDTAAFREVLEVNLVGEYRVARAVAMYMADKGIKGSIINISSISSHIVNVPNLQVSYNASKAAINHMTRSMALELLKYGIRVNTLSPGYMATPMSTEVPQELTDAWHKMIPMGRLGNPEELMPAILCFASGRSSYTVGAEMIADGGYVLI
jgi:NAD(P)-dependent dehydrogenase (short-subunit alcohol dehydrogenase family)